MVIEMDTTALAGLMFKHITKTPEDYEKQYPPRSLPQGAAVTRIAPSPTGFMHLGNLFGAVTDERLAHLSDGIFYLRIEDTDAKREVEGGVEMILSVFRRFGLEFDEGFTLEGDNGVYGPYRQRQRAEIYQAYVKRMVEEGKAYPCFHTEEELAAMREQQESQKVNFGYYGPWATCRNLTPDEAAEKIQAGTPYVVRFRSPGDPEKRVHCHDLVKGDMELPENDQDVVLLKSDGIPTYHFAHVIDDHLMRTTHVVRGEEWLATLPIHLQLFEALGFEPPQYVHTAQLMKMEGTSKRKLSKRKDPELALSYYHSQGYPVESVMEYLLTILNSNFEEWRIANPDKPRREFPFTAQKMSASGSLFDIAKLMDVSKNTVSRMSAEDVTRQVLEWAREEDQELYALLSRDEDYAKRIFAIGRGGEKPRKDIGVWSQVKDYLAFFYDELFVPARACPENLEEADCAEILKQYIPLYDETDDNTAWFDKVRALAVQLGFAAKPKDYKKNPDQYKGHVGDVSTVLRLALTGRQNSPDLCDSMKVLGRERSLARLQRALEELTR